jgi:hypothetical protein
MTRKNVKPDGILIANAIGTNFYYVGFTHEPERRIKTLEHGVHHIRLIKYNKLDSKLIKKIKNDLYSLIEKFRVKETWYQLNQIELSQVMDLVHMV